MHTSSRIQSSDFQYRRLRVDDFEPADFSTLFPDYHPQDRVGIVSPCLEDGIHHTAVALLSITTAFYAVLRSRDNEFFNYPQHFALFDGDGRSVQTGNGRLSFDDDILFDAWSWLDVWPSSNWLKASGTSIGMLQKVFDFQINRLFWPASWSPDEELPLLPSHMLKIMKSRLKTVYYYNTETPNTEIHARGNGVTLIRESLEQLPSGLREAKVARDADAPYVERYRSIPVDEFLDHIAHCFEKE